MNIESSLSSDRCNHMLNNLNDRNISQCGIWNYRDQGATRLGSSEGPLRDSCFLDPHIVEKE